MTIENPNPATDPTPTDPAADPASPPAEDPTVLGGDPDPADPADPAAADPAAADPQAGDPPADPAAVTGPPESYTLTTPDGFEAIDTDVLTEATPIFQELGLTNEQADKLTPLAAGLVKKTMDRAEAAITNKAVEQRKEWNAAFEADPDIGGANKDATIAAAARAFDHYGLKKGEGLRQLLDESGLGNHPDLIRFVAKVGHDLAEGSFDRGEHVNTPKTPEGKLYGAEFQPKG